MKKILYAILVCMMCVGIVGCGSGKYGIFTKDCYKLLTEDARTELTVSYDEMIEMVNLINAGMYSDSIKVYRQNSDNMTANQIIIESKFASIFSSLVGKEYTKEEAWDKYIDSLTSIREDLQKEYADKLIIEKDKFNEMREFIYNYIKF